MSGKPIKFAGDSKRAQDLEPFCPDRMASCILGMGNMISLVERTSTEVTNAGTAWMRE